MFKKLFAFTLSELLVALGVIGVIATLTIPTFYQKINNDMFVTQLKDITQSIEQLAKAQMALKLKTDLNDTIFSDPDKLLTSDNFTIAKVCDADNAFTDCWNSTNYTFISGKKTEAPDDAKTAILKNGLIISYNTNDDPSSSIGYFQIDLNGNEKPNIIGRDYFVIEIRTDGKFDVVGETSITSLRNNCKKNESILCYDCIVRDGWKMKY